MSDQRIGIFTDGDLVVRADDRKRNPTVYHLELRCWTDRGQPEVWIRRPREPNATWLRNGVVGLRHATEAERRAAEEK